MTQLLRSKNLATKFQILVEIAGSQPYVQQKNIAGKLDISSQAVSEYIKELTREGWLISPGRSSYQVTTEGIDWILRMIREVRAYFASVEESIESILVCTAMAGDDLYQGQLVGLIMKDGLLVAIETVGQGARGKTITNAKKGEEVGVSNIEGIVEFNTGEITICRIPGVRRGGSSKIDFAQLNMVIANRGLTGAIGIESLIALRQMGVEPDYFYGVKDAVVEAAHSGLPFLVVCTDDEMSGLLRRLEKEGLGYELLDLKKDKN